MSNFLPKKIKKFLNAMSLVSIVMAGLFLVVLALITQNFKTTSMASQAIEQHVLVQKLTDTAIAAASERDLLKKTQLLKEVEEYLDYFLLVRKSEAPSSLGTALQSSDLIEFDGPASQSRLAELVTNVSGSLQAKQILRHTGILIDYTTTDLLPEIEFRVNDANSKLHRQSLMIFWMTLIIMLVFLLGVVGFGRTLFRPIANKALLNSKTLNAAQAKLEEMEYNDVQTKLPSKRGAERFLSTYKLSEHSLKAAIVIKLEPVARNQRSQSDGFTNLIATELAQRLKQLKGEIDYLAHCGHGKFFVLCDYAAELAGAPRILDRIEQLLFEPITVNESRISADIVSGYLPVSVEMDSNNYYDDACVALDVALALGGQQRIRYTEDIRNKLAENSELATELTVALNTNELKAHYQPQINLETGEIVGFEALVRWYHPTRGILAPGLFLPLITEMGLDDALGEIMLNEGLEALRAWNAEGIEVAQLGINFSQAQLRAPMLVETLRWELDRFDIEPSRLSVEVLENIYVENDDDRIVTNVRALSKLGLNIDLDDFGTGTASITGLRRFCANRIKIDRSYITDLDTNLENQALVSTMINMARGLNIEALAEGVETEAEMDALRSFGCKTIQGYAIAKPMSFNETIVWITDYNEALVERNKSNQAVAV